MTAPVLGSLRTAPALDHPELLAEPVQRVLSEHSSLDALVAPIEPDLADTAQFCAAYDVGLDISANCVVVAGQRDGVERIAACLVLATTRADVNRTVRKRLGVRKASFLPMEVAVERTGMEYGGITPLGVPADWLVLVDEAATQVPYAIIGSGVRHSKLALPGSALSRLPGAEVVDGLGLPT
ncbi:MAG TPA: YbaK/EbsC family protein [Jiangellaceae bacterium]|nr:YbaK/EbsC family protein [Jiangellaceae bacterium]